MEQHTNRRDNLLAVLEANAEGYFDDDPDQFTVGAVAALLTYIDDEELAYQVGRVLVQSAGLSIYVDDYEGSTRAGFERALSQHSDRYYYDE